MARAPEYKIDVTPHNAADPANITVKRFKGDGPYAVAVSDGVNQAVHKTSFLPENLPADEIIHIVSDRKEIGQVPVDALQKAARAGNGEVLEHYMQAALKKPGLAFKDFAETDTARMEWERKAQQLKDALEKGAPGLLPELLAPLAPILGALPFLPLPRPDPPLAHGAALRRKSLDRL